MNDYLVKASTAAEPGAVYRLLVDGRTWPDWMAVDSYLVEPPDGSAPPGGPQGVGDVRVFRSGKYVSREEIVELIPDRRVSYTARNDMVREYRASIELHPLPSGGTEIVWYANYALKIPALGLPMQVYLRRIMWRAVEGLARHAGRGAPACPGPGGSPAPGRGRPGW